MYPYTELPRDNPLGGLFDTAIRIAPFLAGATGVAWAAGHHLGVRYGQAEARARRQAQARTQPTQPSPARAPASVQTAAALCQAHYGEQCTLMETAEFCAFELSRRGISADCRDVIAAYGRQMEAERARVLAEDARLAAEYEARVRSYAARQETEATQRSVEQETVNVGRTVVPVTAKEPGEYHTGVFTTPPPSPSTPMKGLETVGSATSWFPLGVGAVLGIGAWALYKRHERKRQLEELADFDWRP